jgi:hypothetical protein
MLSEEFSVTAEYVRLLKRQHLDPERFRKKELAKLSKKLTDEEVVKFHEVLSTTVPKDHGFPPHPKWWDLAHGASLADLLFNKRPSIRILKDHVTPYMPKREDFRFGRPEAPKQLSLEDISPEFASDPDYVAYCLSPICQQIREREYELALADYEERFAESDERERLAEERMKAMAEPSFQFAPIGKRTGKHAKGKGSPFTPPKKKRR